MRKWVYGMRGEKSKKENERGGKRKGIKENERGEKRKGIKENGEEKTIDIKLMNIQGFTEDKWIEILEETGDDSILFLTETQI